MDAKPQKPLRVFRPNDENALPAVSLPKTLHSRTMSSPALSALAAAGAMRPAAKRAAFADVSNTSVANRLVKDDLMLPTKASSLKTKDSTQGLSLSRKSSVSSAHLSRPAQRPARVSTEATKPSLQSRLLPELPEISQTVETRKAIEPEVAEAVSATAAPLIEEIQNSATDSVVYVNTRLEPVSETFVPAQQISQLEPAAHSILLEEPPILLEENLSASSEALVSSFPIPEIYQPALPPISQFPVTLGVIDPQLEQNIIEAINATQISVPELLPELIPLPADPEPEADHAVVDPSPAVPEQEEYWDDDEDDENYEDDGYVTARSFRSRDGITSNATTLLVPRPNYRTRKEIAAARELVESMKTIEDVEDEKFDTTMVAEYGDEIFDYLRHMEAKMQPNPYYMDYQTEIQWSMRSVLMDWIVQVHMRFSLLPETLFLCANYIDRFLSAKVVSLNKLQLVGATALFVAAKYEEINCPSVQEIVYMVDNGYSMDEVLKAERFMLSMLQFELGWPGPMSFLRRISKADDYDLETRTLAKYLLEVTIMDERFLGCPPSFTAAGAHCMARMMLQKGDWSPAHVYYSNYTYAQLVPLISLIFECCEEAEKHHAAIFDKYADKRYKNASSFVSNQIHKHHWRPNNYYTESMPVPASVYEQLIWAQDYVPVAWQ